MKNRLIVLILLLNGGITFAQNGMDYTGAPTARYSRLRNGFPTNALKNLNNEKALGVYQNDIVPLSFLEINSTPAYMPFPMPGLGLGELFRTNGPGNVNNVWRMFAGVGANSQKFRLTSLSSGNTNNVELSVEQDGYMNFFTDGTNANERFRLHHLASGVPMLPFPFNANTNPLNPMTGNRLTRISISRDGNNPVTRPLSVLHIGYDWPFPGAAGAQGGFRSWQDLGTMYMALTDNMYTGMREKDPTDPTGRTSKVSSGSLPTDNQDAVITWGDNSAGNAPNPGGQPNDNFAFIFHGPLSNTLPDKFAGTEYGREVMRLTGFGNVGIGPVFYDNATPQNLLHVNNDSLLQTYIQISNKLATFQTATDGFHLGITGGPIATTGGIAEIKQFEDRDMRFFTNNNQWMVIKENGNGNLGRVGIRTNTPGNRLEINSLPADPVPSGLRFTNLTAASVAGVNPGPGVLAVDFNGDVIYVNSPPAGNLGGPCPSTNLLASNWDIPLNNNNFIFSGNNGGAGTNNVGIGITGCVPQAKLEVLQNSGSPAGSIGILVDNTDVVPCFSTNQVIGLKSLVSNPANGGLYKIAGWFEVPQPNACGLANNYAIVVPQGGGQVEIGYAPVSGNFASLVNINGALNSANYVGPSDASLKNTVNTLPNSLNKIKSLRPVTYKWNNPNDSIMTGIHAGFIAQEVDTVIPQLVRTNQNGLKTLAYIEMIPYLVSGMQELIKQNKQQDSIIQVLTQNVASCCQNSAAKQTGINGNDPQALSQINITLTDADVIILNQNVPNPFAEQTTITYNVPEKYGFAQLIFKTVDGKIIKTVDITKKGRGQVNVFANDLSNGLYMYTLIVDGMTIDTKKMVKQN